MYSTLISIALFAIAGVNAVSSVETPKLTQCQKATINWSGAKGNALVSVVNPSKPCDDSLVDLPEAKGDNTQWTVTIPAGTKVQLAVEDDSDDVAWSGVVTVEKSDDDSCLKSHSSSASSKPTSSAKPSSSAASSGATLVIPPTSVPANVAPVPAGTAGAAGTGAVANVGGAIDGDSSGALAQVRVPALWVLAAGAMSLFML